MNRPDPTDIIGTLAYIVERVEEVARQKDETRYGPTLAAQKLGFHKAHCWSKPWRVPTFGLEFDGEYPLSQWQAWFARPEAERRAEWDALPLAKRSVARGLVQPEAKSSRRSA